MLRAILLCVLISSPALAQPIKVTRIVDGDTVQLSTGEYVRMLGYNTVERGHPDYYKHGKWLADLILREYVNLTSLGKDRYRRILGIIELPELCVNAFMREKLRYTSAGFNKYDRLTTAKQRQSLNLCGWKE